MISFKTYVSILSESIDPSKIPEIEKKSESYDAMAQYYYVQGLIRSFKLSWKNIEREIENKKNIEKILENFFNVVASQDLNYSEKLQLVMTSLPFFSMVFSKVEVGMTEEIFKTDRDAFYKIKRAIDDNLFKPFNILSETQAHFVIEEMVKWVQENVSIYADV